MAANNIVLMIGHVGKDPEMKYLDTGNIISKFRLAVKRPVKDKSGIDTDWFDCVFFGKQAELVGKLIRKGTLISVVGNGRIEQWGEGENKRSKFVIYGDSFQLLGPKKQEEIIIDEEYKDVPPSLDLEEDDLPEDTNELPF